MVALPVVLKSSELFRVCFRKVSIGTFIPDPRSFVTAPSQIDSQMSVTDRHQDKCDLDASCDTRSFFLCKKYHQVVTLL